jgi:hypothetical protein
MMLPWLHSLISVSLPTGMSCRRLLMLLLLDAGGCINKPTNGGIFSIHTRIVFPRTSLYAALSNRVSAIKKQTVLLLCHCDMQLFKCVMRSFPDKARLLKIEALFPFQSTSRPALHCAA